jgi:hypothetical protein
MSPHFKFAQISSVFAAIPLLARVGGASAGHKRAALTILTLLACTVVAAPGDQLDAALRLLPKRPEVVVVDSLDSRAVAAAAVWGTRPEQVRAFSLTGQRAVYVNRSVDPYRCASQKNQTCVLLLAALIWHEAAHVDGEGEERAQLREEALFRQFVTEHRVEFAAGQVVLRAMAGRRAGR